MVTVLCLKTANASNTVRCLWSEEGSILEREQSASTAGRESQEVQIASSAPLALCGRTTRPREGSEKRRNPGSPCTVVRMGKRKTLPPSSPQWGENSSFQVFLLIHSRHDGGDSSPFVPPLGRKIQPSEESSFFLPWNTPLCHLPDRIALQSAIPHQQEERASDPGFIACRRVKQQARQKPLSRVPDHTQQTWSIRDGSHVN